MGKRVGGGLQFRLGKGRRDNAGNMNHPNAILMFFRPSGIMGVWRVCANQNGQWVLLAINLNFWERLIHIENTTFLSLWPHEVERLLFALGGWPDLDVYSIESGGL